MNYLYYCYYYHAGDIQLYTATFCQKVRLRFKPNQSSPPSQIKDFPYSLKKAEKVSLCFK